jgi:hypothetical protein
MATPLPIIRGTSTALYPFKQTYVCVTGISDGQAATPSRWVKSPPLVRFEFPYNPLKQADKNTLKGAFVSAKGQFTTNLSATPGTEYDYLSFDMDEFAAVEQKTTQYDVRWNLTQTLPQNWTPGASGGAYPALSTTAICELPYTQKKRFQTIVSKMESGPKYTYAEFGASLTGFPTDGLMGWEFTEGQLTDAEVSTKIAHFLANWGDCFPFQFTDEDGTTYSNVYYASPELTIVRAGVNQSGIKTALVQMY